MIFHRSNQFVVQIKDRMNAVKKVNLVLLVLLSLSTGVVKIIGLEADVKIFASMGFSYAATVFFGVIQTIGGILLIFPKMRRAGAVIMVITFCIATAGVFISGMTGFGIFSILFICMALMAYM